MCPTCGFARMSGRRIRGLVTAVSPIDGMPPSAAAESFAVRRRRESRRQEWAEQTKLAEMLDKYLNAADTFWTSLENKPLSLLSGLFQKRRGVRSGLPDLLVIWRAKPIFVEIKSRAGVASKAQKQICAKLKLAGADWYLARSGRAALMALNLSGVAAQALGGTVRGPDAAAAAGAGRGRTATGGTAAMAGASARP
jgi:hypothetical protein